MINYRKDQIPIINYKNGTMAVQAVPGAGKTFIITHLVSKLIKEKSAENSKILVLTYMNSAVNNFKNRIKSILKEENINSKNNYEVMTIHSLAVKIIKEKPQGLMINDEFLILDDLQKSIIINDCIKKYKETESGKRVYPFFVKPIKDIYMRELAFAQWDSYFFDIIISCISKLKYKDIDSKKLENILGNDYKGFLRVVLNIYKDYEQRLKNEGFLDFDDLLILAYKSLLNDIDLRNKFKTRYKYIFEDECQDSNEMQGKIIKLISEGNDNLVRVGDINQSITGTFSMSNPKYFKDFSDSADYFYKMDMSSRSSKDVLELANYLVESVCEFNKDAFSNIKIKTVEEGFNPNPKDYQIYYKEYSTFNDELLGVIRYITYLKNSHKDKSIGILLPFNKDVENFCKLLDDKDIEYEQLGANSFYKRKGIIYLTLIIDFLINCNDTKKLTLVIDKVFLNKFEKNNQSRIRLLEILLNYKTEEIIYDDILYDEIIFLEDNILNEYKQAVNITREILEFNITNIENLILFIKDKLNLEKEDRAIFDYLAFYFKYLLIDNNLTLEKVLEIISNKGNFNKIIEIFYEIEGYEIQKGSITVCNYHKSKGLEWDIIFLVGITDYNFPNIKSKKFTSEKWYLIDKYKNLNAVMKYEIDNILNKENQIYTDIYKDKSNYFYEDKIETINEKLRLLYVGITRAKEMIFFSNNIFKDEEAMKKNKKQKRSEYMDILLRIINKNYNKR